MSSGLGVRSVGPVGDFLEKRCSRIKAETIFVYISNGGVLFLAKKQDVCVHP